jgi:hypothetical protein
MSGTPKLSTLSHNALLAGLISARSSPHNSPPNHAPAWRAAPSTVRAPRVWAAPYDTMSRPARLIMWVLPSPCRGDPSRATPARSVA